MAASRQTKNAWLKKLTTLADGVDKAQEDLLVAIYKAREDGLSQADVAYMIGDRSSSSIKAKEDKGKAILKARKGGSGAP